MKAVRCDKCGLITSICLIDSDYVCNGENPWLIREKDINGKTYDLCQKCCSILDDRKHLVEEDFIKDLGVHID